MSFAFFPIGSKPAPYDIVWCRFPYEEAPHLPAPDDHPALVKQTFDDNDGNPWVTVIFGTSKKLGERKAESFRIPDAELHGLGLTKPTKLCLWREETIPWAREFFSLPFGCPIPTRHPMREGLKKKFQTDVAYYQHNKANRPAANTPPTTGSRPSPSQKR